MAMSKTFTDSLGLKYPPSCRVINTPLKEGQLKAVGVCNPMQVQEAGINRIFTMQPLVVVDGLIQDMNMGQHFLGRNDCTLASDSRGGKLQVGGQMTAPTRARQAKGTSQGDHVARQVQLGATTATGPIPVSGPTQDPPLPSCEKPEGGQTWQQEDGEDPGGQIQQEAN